MIRISGPVQRSVFCKTAFLTKKKKFLPEKLLPEVVVDVKTLLKFICIYPVTSFTVERGCIGLKLIILQYGAPIHPSMCVFPSNQPSKS